MGGSGVIASHKLAYQNVLFVCMIIFQACPRGYRTNGTVCLECTGSPDLYDWLYLGFMASLSLIFHWFFIDFFSKRDKKR